MSWEFMHMANPNEEAARDSIIYSYKHGFSGFAAKLTKSQAKKIAELPDVVHVIPNHLYKLHTTRSWDYLGLSTSSPPTNFLHEANMGDGVIIGGHCQSSTDFDPAKACNRKLIGGKYFIKGLEAELGRPIIKDPSFLMKEFASPRDRNGHGTHTSSTAGGSFAPNASYHGLAYGTVRGGAPKARLAMYKVCWDWPIGGCDIADIIKGIDEAIHDGVDILSLSLGTNTPQFADVDMHSIGFPSFHAVMNGITVVCSGGNDGPISQTVADTSPWIITVAASSIDRSFPTLITLGNNRTFTGQSLYTGKENGFISIVHQQSSDFEDNRYCDTLNTNDTWVAGKVVLCFLVKGDENDLGTALQVVQVVGGLGLIVAKNPTRTLDYYASDFPSIGVSFDIGAQLLDYIRYSRNPQVKLSPTRTHIGKPVSTHIASFSSRGPNSVAPAILKPDIAAPGVNILAAVLLQKLRTNLNQEHPWQLLTCLALLRCSSPCTHIGLQLLSTWQTDPHSGEPIIAEGNTDKIADPFDFGGGLVNANAAKDPGLVYDIGFSDYVFSYLCPMGYNTSAIGRIINGFVTCANKMPSLVDFNVPSLTIPSLRKTVTVKRTVTNVGPVNSKYKAIIVPPLGITIKVKPETLIFNSSTKKISFTLTISTSHKYTTGYYFGSLTWTDGVHKSYLMWSVWFLIICSNCTQQEVGITLAFPNILLQLTFFIKPTWATEYGRKVKHSTAKAQGQSLQDGRAIVSLVKNLIQLRHRLDGQQSRILIFSSLSLRHQGIEMDIAPTHQSTAGGLFSPNASYQGLGYGTVKGGAPKARIAMYKFFISIGLEIPLYADVDMHNGIAFASFHAVIKGITVIGSGGNEGPYPQTVVNISPWILTVAASSIDRSFPTLITLGNNQTFPVSSLIILEKKKKTNVIICRVNPCILERRLVLSALHIQKALSLKIHVISVSSKGFCNNLNTNDTWAAGKVVLCFLVKGDELYLPFTRQVVQEVGGLGLVVAKNPTRALYYLASGFPSIEVNFDIGAQLLDYIRYSSKAESCHNSCWKTCATHLASFSSRGPNSVAPAILKPDIAAPGVNILAAFAPAEIPYEFDSGTSMAAPHISGIVALLKSLHGNPNKIAHPFDFGGGLVNANAAKDPGLVYDMGTFDYILYLCSKGYNNRAISMLIDQAAFCPIKRPSILELIFLLTITNFGPVNSKYKAIIEPPLAITIKVNPETLIFNSSTRKISFTLTISTSHKYTTDYYFGSLTWTDGLHRVRSPISVRNEFPELVHIVYMGRRQHDDIELITSAHHQILTFVLGSPEAARDSIIYSYKHGFSGFAARLTKSQAKKIAGTHNKKLGLPWPVHIFSSNKPPS
ncbi:hypothetical protein H5410_017189 [Solanum commersonii]|uniref:Uncharacterized protein n=1 Tax=Solanum commersonii TaxID=4109 RepID=A0A9J5ZYF8_SOLCO|nr:hypothetical protein H5410_017189 [Solanum commersonii]